MATPQQTPELPPAASERALPPSPSEQEYTHLIAFHEKLVKYVLTAIGIIGAVAAFVFYKDLNSVKADAESEVQQVRTAAELQIEASPN